MSEKPGYAERGYRLYGHRVTKRRAITEWGESFGVSLALAIGAAVAMLEEPSTLVICLTTVGVFISSFCYRVHKMNVNGFEHEKPEDYTNAHLFPWKFK